MSVTQAKLNKLRQIRHQMEREIKNAEIETERISKKIKYSQNQPIQANRKLPPSSINKQEPPNHKVKPKDEFKFYILTRNLILATSNRQLRAFFSLWKSRMETKQSIPTRKPLQRKVINDAQIPSYSFKPTENKQRVDRAMVNAAYSRVGNVSDSDTESTAEHLSDTETNEQRFSPSPIHTSILKSNNPRAVWKNLPETPAERRVTIKNTTPVTFSRDSITTQTPGGTSSSDHEFTFTPQPGTPVQRQVTESPVGVRVSDTLNRSKHESIEYRRPRNTTREFVDENKTNTSSSLETPKQAAYLDEMIEDEDSFVVSEIAATPKQLVDIESDDDIVDGYIEESFSRQTSPKSVVKKNFSGSLKDKMEESKQRRESVVRDLSGFEDISSGSPTLSRSTEVRMTPESNKNEKKHTFRKTPQQSVGWSTPVRKAKLAEILEYVESIGNETDLPMSSTTSVIDQDVSMHEGSIDIGDIAFEQATPYLLRQGHSPPRFMQSESPKSSPIHVSKDVVVEEVASPYSVKKGEYLSEIENVIETTTSRPFSNDVEMSRVSAYIDSSSEDDGIDWTNVPSYRRATESSDEDIQASLSRGEIEKYLKPRNEMADLLSGDESYLYIK